MDQDLVGNGIYNIAASAAALGHISPWTLRKHVAQGTVEVTRLGRRVFVRGEELQRIRREGLPRLRSALAEDRDRKRQQGAVR